MLEILAIIYLCRLNGSTAKKKGHEPARYVVFSVLLWIGGEVLGGIVALILTRGDDGAGLIYIFALLGAVWGACVSRLIVNRLPSVPAIQTEVFD
jgi:hypothetical protein